MSKSRGNVIDPLDLISKYGVDYVRYFLVAEIHCGQDGDFSYSSFGQRINSDLADDVGNLMQRVLTMVKKNFGSTVPQPNDFTDEDRETLRRARESLANIRHHIDDMALKLMVEEIIMLAKRGNKYIDTNAPWTLVKYNNMDRAGTVLYVLMELLRCVAVPLQCIMPSSSADMLEQLGVPLDLRTFESVAHRTISPGTVIGVPKPLFPKIVL